MNNFTERFSNTAEGRFVLSLLTISFLWGVNVVFIKVGADAIGPLYMASFRFFLAAGTLYLYLYIKRLSPLPHPEAYRAYIIISFLFALQIGFFYLGAFKTSASHAVVLINVHIFFVALLAHFFLLHDRLNPLKIAGMIIAFLGVITIVWDSPEGAVNRPSLEGDFFILWSAFVLALQTVFTKRVIQKIDPVKVVFWEMFLGASILLVWGFVSGEPFPQIMPQQLVISLLYQGFVSGALCFVAITALLKQYSASHIASFTVLVPFFGVLCSHLYLGDRLTLHLILGGIFMVMGLILTTVAKRTY